MSVRQQRAIIVGRIACGLNALAEFHGSPRPERNRIIEACVQATGVVEELNGAPTNPGRRVPRIVSRDGARRMSFEVALRDAIAEGRCPEPTPGA